LFLLLVCLLAGYSTDKRAKNGSSIVIIVSKYRADWQNIQKGSGCITARAWKWH